MASVAMSAIPSRRRPLTYGKKPSRHPFPHDFQSLGQLTPTKSPSKFVKTSSAIPKLSTPKGSAINNDEAIFDVPSEEDIVGSPMPSARRPATNPGYSEGDHHGASTRRQSCLSSSFTSKKRKRSASQTASSRHTPPSEDTDAQASDQLARETLARKQSFGKPRAPLNISNQGPDSSASSPKRQSTEGGAQHSKAKRKARKSPSSCRIAVKPSQFAVVVPTPHDSATLTPEPAPPPDNTVQTPRRHCFDVDMRTPRTPPDSASPSDTAGSTSKVAITPRQARMWDALLNDEQDPSTLERMRSLKLETTTKKTLATTREQELPRKRLVDTMMSGAGLEAKEQEQSILENPKELNLAPPQRSEASDSAELTSSQQSAGFSLGPKVTYAQQRSYLRDDGDSIDNLLSQPLDADITFATQDVAQPRFSQDAKKGDLEVLEADGDETGALRSIHDLRASADKTRFNEEIERIIIDISDRKKSALSRRRSALLELSSNLCDPKFKLRFAQHATAFQVFYMIEAETDPISGCALAAALALCLFDEAGKASPLHIQDPIGLQSLKHMLQYARDVRAIARDRQTNMSRIAQDSVVDFEQILKQSAIWSHHQPGRVTPQLLALKAMELLTRRLRESGNADMILDQQTLDVMLSILAHSVQRIAKEAEAASVDHWLIIETILSALESSSIASTAASDHNVLWTKPSLARLIQSMDVILNVPTCAKSLVQPLILRLGLNLANSDEQKSEQFAGAAFVPRVVTLVTQGLKSRAAGQVAREGKEADDIDQLLLGLGFLFNLAEMSGRARETLAVKCSNDVRRMAEVIRDSRGMYTEADSMEAMQINVAVGYLAVLLGNLCLNEKIRRLARESLPAHRLATLVEAIEEFIVHHKEVDRREGTNDIWTNFTARLQRVAESLKQLEKEER